MNKPREMTAEEIAEFNASEYDRIGTGMELIKDADKWIPPKVLGNPNRQFRSKGRC